MKLNDTLSPDTSKIFLFIIGAPVALLLLVILLIQVYFYVASDKVTGAIVESNFALSDDSRLPKWFNIPQGYTRENLTVIIYYYVSDPGKPDLKAELIDKKGRSSEDIVTYGGGKTLETKYGYDKDINDVRGDYPHFAEGTIDGIKDIIEHRAMEPIFYISDKAN